VIVADWVGFFAFQSKH